jgi:hypothetical protein
MWKGYWVAVVMTLFVMGCAATYDRPLTSRGLPEEERKDWIIQNGYGIPESVKQAFLDGYVVDGMKRELVFQLFGAPDRSSKKDGVWEYINRRGTLIVGINFKNDKIEGIQGDPSGGAGMTAPAGAPPAESLSLP